MDPITLGLGALVIAAVAYLRRPVVNPKKDCNAAAAGVAVAGATVSGGAAGMSAGPVGAGAGAGIGLALAATSTLASPCGQQWGKHAIKQLHVLGQNACAKADDLYKILKSHGGSIPGWSQMSCDQKLGAVSAALAAGGWPIVAGVAVGAVQGATSRTKSNVTDTHTEVGGGHATVAGHKIF